MAARPLPAPPVTSRPVCVIGGLSVGGAGRTPVVAHLAARAQALGASVAVLGHGYRGSTRAPTRVDAPDARRFGDEAAALFGDLPGVPIWVGARRDAVLDAMPAFDLILVDGGLLDPRCPRRHTVLVIDASASTRVLPAGPLRASLDAVARDWTWLHRSADPAPGRAADVRSTTRLVGVRAPDGTLHPPEWLAGRRVRVLCGIARPQSFVDLLEAGGARVVERRIRADHAWFTARDRARLGPDWIVTTKDRARLPGAPVSTAVCALDILQGDPDALLAVACAR